jgi:hypothetical protein
MYLTLDHVVPASVPVAQACKYASDPCKSPYSYTLGPLPPPLQHGAADDALARTHTVPSTERMRLPVSPATFAVYLQSALANGHAAADDASGGLRQLARMVDECLPDPEARTGAGEEDGPGRGGQMRRVFGRLGERQQAKRGPSAVPQPLRTLAARGAPLFVGVRRDQLLVEELDTVAAAQLDAVQLRGREP